MSIRSSSGLRFFSALILILFGLQISGCTDPSGAATNGLENLKLTFQDLNATPQLQKVSDLQAAAMKASSSANALPELVGRPSTDPAPAVAFVTANQDRIMAYLSSTEEQSSDLREFIFDVSKEALKTDDPVLRAQDDALVYYALQLQASFHRKVIQNITPLLIYAGSDSIKDVPEVTSFRQAIGGLYFQHFGAQMVSQKDANTIIGKLNDLKKIAQLPGYIERNIQSAQAAMRTRMGQQHKALNTVAKNMTADQQDTMKNSVQGLMAGFKDATFLYSDNLHFSGTENLLIVFGNLTWGLLNTLVGGGFVAADALFATLTLGQFVPIPGLSLSSNGHMIHVDLGYGIGEMSLGLFELDTWDNGPSSGHEGIHAVQSALFGPLYLPTILFTYVISGFDQGFMEDWANDWAWMD